MMRGQESRRGGNSHWRLTPNFMEHDTSLRDALSYDGDLELRFQGGEAIPVHSQKLKLASTVLRDVIIAVLDDLIASSAAKRRKTAEGSSSVTDQQELPSLKVRC